MKKAFIIITILLLCSCNNIFSQNKEEIENIIESMNLIVNIPKGFFSIPQIEQEPPGTYYTEGFKHEEIDIELRYALYPASFAGENPDAFYDVFPYTIISNITGNFGFPFNKDWFTYFPDWAVKNDFNGDIGFTTTTEKMQDIDFMKNYKYVMFTVVINKIYGMFVNFILFNEMEMLMEHESIFLPTFYALRFKP